MSRPTGSVDLPVIPATDAAEYEPQQRVCASSRTAASTPVPAVLARSPVVHPLATETPSWVDVAPIDVRLRVLSRLTEQPAPETVQADLASYAQVCRATSNDVKAFHRQWRDPRAALLASRKLVQSAWEAAKAQGWFGREQAFKTAIGCAMADYSAVLLDGREGAAYAAYLPAAVSAMYASDLQHLHLRLGTAGHHAGASYASHAVAALRALMDGSMARLAQGRPLPTVFLSVQGMPLSLVANALKAAPVHLNIVGLSLCRDAGNHEVVASSQRTARHRGDGIYTDDASGADWAAVFAQLKGSRYLYLSGWRGVGLSDALLSFFHANSSLEELHVPLCQLSLPCAVHLVRSIEAMTTFKCFGAGGVACLPTQAYRGRASLANALKNNPDMVYVGYRDDLVIDRGAPDFEQLWRSGRFWCDALPAVMRALPEIYAKADLFHPAR